MRLLSVDRELNFWDRFLEDLDPDTLILDQCGRLSYIVNAESGQL